MTRRQPPLRALLAALLVLTLLAVVPPAARAAPGDLDPTFGAGGRVYGPPTFINAITIDSAGRIVAAGRTRTAPSDFLVLRYLANGTLDPTFDGDVDNDNDGVADGNGIVRTNFGGTDEAFAVTVVGDKILVAGTGGPGQDFLVARYLPDGKLDTDFGAVAPGATTRTGKTTVPDGDGRRSLALALALDGDVIVLAGASHVPDPVAATIELPNVALAIIAASDGTPRSTVTVPALPGFGEGRGAVVTAPGKVAVAGTALSQDPSTSQVFLARFVVDAGAGSFALDPTFGPAGVGFSVGPPGTAAALARQGAQLVTAGSTTRVIDPTSGQATVPPRFLVTRHSEGGILDTSFGAGGLVITDFPSGPAHARGLAVDGERIVAAGGAGADFAVARYTRDGALDGGFGDGGKVTTDFGNDLADVEFARAVAVDGTGRPVAAGGGGATATGAFAGVAVLARYEASSPTAMGDAHLTASGSPDPVLVGGRLTMTATLRNLGLGPLYRPVLTASVPAGTVVESTTASRGVCRAPSASELRCDLGGLSAGDETTVSVVLMPTAPGALTSTLRVAASNEAGPGPNEASLTVAALDAPGEWVASRPMATGRYHHSETMFPDGKVLVVGGVARNSGEIGVLASAELYDPATESWSGAGEMSTARSGHAATLLGDGRVLVSGGEGPGGLALASSEIFSPGAPPAQAWTQGPPMATGRVHHAATRLVTGEVLVVAGAGQAEVPSCQLYEHVPGEPPRALLAGSEVHLRSAEVYRRGSDGSFSWHAAGCLGHGRARSVDGKSTTNGDHTLTALPGGGAIAVGGWRGWHWGGENMAQPEVFDPVAGLWDDAAPPAGGLPRLGHTAVGRPGGAVLVAGGSQTNAAPATTPSAWVYRPPGSSAGGTWEAGPSMLRGRLDHTVSSLSDGSVLVAGGYRDGLAVLNTSERYDASIGWSSAGFLATPRTAHTASTFASGPLAQCGQLCGATLLAGGISNQFELDSLATTELYFPQPRVSALTPPAGPAAGGTNVTITGSGLASVTSVRFGDSAATAVTPDPTNPDGRLTAVAPARAKGPVDVTVTTRGGTSAPAPAARFGYVGLPGQVGDLAATAVSETSVRLSFSATDDGSGTRPATRYVVKQSTGPIVDQASFDAAASVCPTACTFRGLNLVGDPASLTLQGVERGFTYRYAVRALDADGRAGPISNVATIALGDAAQTATPAATGRGGGVASGGGVARVAGYRLVASDGGIFAFGGARFLGSTGALRLNQPIVGMSSTPSGDGYWLVGADGGVFAFGDARFLGSTGNIRLNRPIVGMASTPSGNGYWLVASDGGVFAFGDARFLGSTGALRLNQPVVGMAATPSGRGYRLVASDGGIFAFGDARFLGSTGAIRLNRPVVGAASTPSGNGYWLVASDGGIFAFGDARFLGSTGALRLSQPIVAMAATPSGRGYWLAGADGGVFAFGDAAFLGSTGGVRLNRPVVGMS